MSAPTGSNFALFASRLSVVVAVTLIIAKSAAWVVTDSVSILASLADSSMDALASVINLLALRYALKPADADHRFGHGKAEAIAAVAQAAFIVGSSLILVVHCVERFLAPERVHVMNTDIGLAVMVFSIVLTAILVLVQRVAIRKSGSSVVKADQLHYISDLLTNLSILGALALAHAGFLQADVYIGLGVAAYICYGAIKIGYPALQALMDRELPREIVDSMLDIARSHPGVSGVHDIRTRQSGLLYVVQLHLEMDPATPLSLAHRISDEVETSIMQRYPNADIIIHQDPAGLYERRQVV